ncbi:MAG: tRNA preQ1(34) S-adenosylmethionine ribosyltransferase-isomerase QueA [Kiritimatiellae bacterium]|nr:tRNA preQ1(34) S-adenosylmethionine ribosyltransferase-isomerase QueA [Kiritimatiellia bacterium]MDD5522197.1 tRNA preQ1(34) S-adenosylmethionine ribosyltransferase-isomerase QueA [Kiritimatiellia bacterium]
MKTSDFHFELPRELIAQEPLPERSHARMMVVHRNSGELEHKHVTDLPAYLKAGDLLVVNDTRVIPARVFGKRNDTGGRVELLLVEKQTGNEHKITNNQLSISKYTEVWDVFYRASGRPRIGMVISFAGGRLTGEVLSLENDGRVCLKLTGDKPVLEILEKEGFAPVPPYIHRPEEHTPLTERDRQNYQTIYAHHPGAVAAPTAGLHFTPELLEMLTENGVKRTAITLHVGPGTFKPVKTAVVEDHKMESERYEINDETAELINSTRRNGGKVVAVGSTTVRTLETIISNNNLMVPCSGRTSLFIYPPYRFGIVDMMLTNFHLPESSLLMMVSAFAGRELIMKVYTEAVASKYRFYSYGDCMLIV